MFDLTKEWSISFAGCGFMGIYYVGATSCIRDRFPRLLQDASRMYGASAGSLMAAILTIGIPLEQCCTDLMFMAKEARKYSLGPLHPAYNLVQIVQDSLRSSLPADAHVRASGRLCVSLTRVSDRKNVLVSEFNSREELVEALVCSCFVPFYCGVIPPTYRGVHYVDGAVSDNLPRCHLRNTITFSAYAGESDLCPRASTLNFHEVRFNNVSIQVNSENMHRVANTFFPPQPEVMSEICQKGYMDALRFLQEQGLISSESPLRSLETDSARPCCELVKAEESGERLKEAQEHLWLDPQLVSQLPADIRKVLCQACRESHTSGGLLGHVTQKVTSYLQLPRALPAVSPYSLATRLADWIPDVPRDMSWLYSKAEEFYKQAWRDKAEGDDSESALRRCTSLPLDLHLLSITAEDTNTLPMTPEASPASSHTFTWDTQRQVEHMTLTPPPTPSLSPRPGPEAASGESGSGWGLGRAVDWIRNTTHTSNH